MLTKHGEICIGSIGEAVGLKYLKGISEIVVIVMITQSGLVRRWYTQKAVLLLSLLKICQTT
jgi:hypothetical protein